jgi:carbonic anhydrase
MIFHLSTRITCGLAAAFCMAVAPEISRAQESHAPHWSYEGKENPRHWGSLDPAFGTCKMGHNQSPINISHPKLADLPELKFDYKAVPLSIIDNGHTIMINYAPGSTLTVGHKTYTPNSFISTTPARNTSMGGASTWKRTLSIPTQTATSSS